MIILYILAQLVFIFIFEIKYVKSQEINSIQIHARNNLARRTSQGIRKATNVLVEYLFPVRILILLTSRLIRFYIYRVILKKILFALHALLR